MACPPNHFRRRRQVPTLLLAASAAAAAAITASAFGQQAPGWQVTFDDEFNGTTLNGDIGTDTWSNLPRWGQDNINNESEIYESSNVSVSGGYLHLTAQKLTTPINYKGVNYYYTSGEVQTQGTENGVTTATQPFSQQYGMFTISAKAPAGQGFWPAFWLLPENLTWPPEIDIFELPQCGPGYDPSGTPYNAHVGVIMPPLGNSTTNQSAGGWVTPPNNFNITNFNTYAVEWDANMIKWLINGNVVYTCANLVPQTPMYMIINLAMGGGWTGPVGGNTTFPSELTVDYCRAYSALAPASFTWNTAAGGNWSNVGTTGWNNTAYPQTPVDTANFNQTLTAAQTVTLSSSITLVALNLNDQSGAHGWNIVGGGNTLTMDSDNSTVPTITAGNGTHSVNAPITLPWMLDVAVNGTQLTFSGPVSGVGSINKSGTGILVLGNASAASSYTGGVTITGGTVRAASSTALGAASNPLSLSAGTTLDLAGNSLSADAVTCAGTIDNTAAGTNVILTVGSNNGSSTFSGTIQNTGGTLGINQAGNGTLTLNSPSTYTGGTTLNAGTLVLGNAAALGNGTLTINGGSLCQLLNANLTIAGGVPEKWNGNFTIPNNANIKTLSTGTGNNVTLGGNIAISITGYLALTVPGVIADGGNKYSLSVSGGGYGQLTLSSANTYSGGTVNNGANLTIGSVSALGTGTFTINGGQTAGTLGNNSQIWSGNFGNIPGTSLNLGTGAVTLTGNRTVTVGNAMLTVGGVIGDGGSNFSLTFKNGQYTDSVVLNAANTFTGGVFLQNTATNTGNLTLKIGNLGVTASASALGTGLLTIAVPATGDGIFLDNTSGAAGTIATNNPEAWNGNFTFVGSNNLNLGNGSVTLGGNITLTASAKLLTVGGAIGDGGYGYGLSKAGSGNLTLSGADTYAGNTTVSTGTLDLKNSLALQDSTLTSNGITFDAAVSTHTFTFGGLSGSGNLTLTDTGNNAVALSAGNNNGNTAYSGILSGNGTLTKIGAGNLTLMGANTYTGTTTVAAGTLVVATAMNGLLAGSSVANNASLQFTGTQTLGNISGNGTTTTSGSLSVTGSMNQTGLINNGTANIIGNSTLGRLSGTGNLTIGNGTLASTVTLATAATSGVLGGSTQTQGAIIIASRSTLDITNNALLLNYGNGTSPLAVVANAVAFGAGSGNASNGAIISSTVNSGTAGKYAVGYADHTEISAIPTGNVEVVYTLAGDANLDGSVDILDYQQMAPHYDEAGAYDWSQGDFNHDGQVDILDYQAMAPNYDTKLTAGTLSGADSLTAAACLTTSDLAKPIGSAVAATELQAADPRVTSASNVTCITAVPEPATLSLLLCGGIPLLGRRRWKCRPRRCL